MKQKIVQYLQQIEEERNIKILYACETGSRAWGFPSPDSDYDVRMIYVHKTDWYLTINERKDSIERMLDENEIDISGWELRKSLGLLKKSNAAMLERIQSPIIYLADEEFRTDILGLGQNCYSKIATMHHYLSMAKRMVFEMQEEESFKLKKFFYALRASSICQWIIEKDQMPPIDFHQVFPIVVKDESLVDRIKELIQFKATCDESYMHKGEEELFDFMNQCIENAQAIKNGLPTSKVQSEALNNLLRKYIAKYDH